jgi:hypothetical protein
MYDSSPISTAAAYMLLATARRLVEAGKIGKENFKIQLHVLPYTVSNWHSEYARISN